MGINTEDNPTDKKVEAGKKMAQKVADLKRRKGARAAVETNLEGDKDDDSNEEDDGLEDSISAQQARQAPMGQSQMKQSTL